MSRVSISTPIEVLQVWFKFLETPPSQLKQRKPTKSSQDNDLHVDFRQQLNDKEDDDSDKKQHHYDKKNAVKHHHIHATVFQRMFRKANVVTMEPKYAMSKHVAEFWCTVTSPAFALPALLYIYPLNTSFLILVQDTNKALTATPQKVEFTFFTHLCLCFSVFTAIMSTKYHQCLCKIYSSLDAGFATVMAYLLACSVWKVHARDFYSQQQQQQWLDTVWISQLCGQLCSDFDLMYLALTMPGFLALLLLFIYRWDKSTAMLATKTISVITPFLMLGTRFNAQIPMTNWVIDLIGISAVICFILDRKGVAVTHPMWHVLGGVYVFIVGTNSIVQDYRLTLKQ
ncbi:hypothetical protein MIR68_002669 [Amoeboaphelidium protococcarum]|nr:hypothetical protein MIR68_002669 [Amoeboaphelidium protococcarum]